jgi:ubiquinone/menaquinone biosynthesis C-methylase UbiE
MRTSKKTITNTKDDTSWHAVANWYEKHLSEDDTYHNKVISPNLARLLGDVKNKNVLDLACGTGYFAVQMAQMGANVSGVDAGADLIKVAKDNLNSKIKTSKAANLNIKYYISDASNLGMLGDNSQDIVLCSLAIQNIENVSATINEVARVLKPSGRMIIIMNHPVLRTPKISSWGYDKVYNIQYRRLDGYMSESKNKMDMNPGEATDYKKYTYSFHRPLQYYFKIFNKCGMCVSRLEEWNSHKKSQKGPKQKAEDKSRSEFPMFMMLEIVKAK